MAGAGDRLWERGRRGREKARRRRLPGSPTPPPSQTHPVAAARVLHDQRLGGVQLHAQIAVVRHDFREDVASGDAVAVAAVAAGTACVGASGAAAARGPGVAALVATVRPVHRHALHRLQAVVVAGAAAVACKRIANAGAAFDGRHKAAARPQECEARRSTAAARAAARRAVASVHASKRWAAARRRAAAAAANAGDRSGRAHAHF